MAIGPARRTGVVQERREWSGESTELCGLTYPALVRPCVLFHPIERPPQRADCRDCTALLEARSLHLRPTWPAAAATLTSVLMRCLPCLVRAIPAAFAGPCLSLPAGFCTAGLAWRSASETGQNSISQQTSNGNRSLQREEAQGA